MRKNMFNMRKLLSVLISLVGFSVVAVDVDARRVSGGKSIGKQREAINPNQASPRTPAQQQQQTTPNTPAQQQQQAAPGTPAQQPQQVAKGPGQQAAPGTPAQPASGASRWLGPLAGLAIGAGLASLFLNNGFAGALGGILLALALALGVFFLFRLFMRGRTAPPLGYAGAGASPAGASPNATRDMPRNAPVEPVMGGRSPAPHSVAATTASARWPGFDEEQFVRHARTNFVDLQGAYNRSDMAAIRDFMTPELAAEVAKDMATKAHAESTDIVTLNAEVVDVATEDGLYVVSVRFTGLLREGAVAEPQPFNEIWHLEKPTRGQSGWLVSGIQQG